MLIINAGVADDAEALKGNTVSTLIFDGKLTNLLAPTAG